LKHVDRCGSFDGPAKVREANQIEIYENRVGLRHTGGLLNSAGVPFLFLRPCMRAKQVPLAERHFAAPPRPAP